MAIMGSQWLRTWRHFLGVGDALGQHYPEFSPSLCDPLFFPPCITLLTPRVGRCLSSTLEIPIQLFFFPTNYGIWGCLLGERDNLQVQYMNLRSGFCRLLLMQIDPFYLEGYPYNLFILTFGGVRP